MSLPGIPKWDRERPNTVQATLISKNESGGNQILRSELILLVSPDYPTFDVTCTGTDGKNRTLTIEVARKSICSFDTVIIYLLIFPTI